MAGREGDEEEGRRKGSRVAKRRGEDQRKVKRPNPGVGDKVLTPLFQMDRFPRGSSTRQKYSPDGCQWKERSVVAECTNGNGMDMTSMRR